MTEEEALQQFGLVPKSEDLATIRRLLADETGKARTRGGQEELMRLFCIQLFALGNPEDSILIWQAKRANFDAGSAIDVQLLCGAGLDATRQYLGSIQSSESTAALAYLDKCEKAGDFKDWSPAKHLQVWRNYYRE